MVAVGVNKLAEQYLLLDDETRDDLARGKYHDQRRASSSAPRWPPPRLLCPPPPEPARLPPGPPRPGLPA